MKNVTVIVEKDADELKKKAGEALDSLVREANGKPLLFLLSGGSSLELLDYIKDTSMEAGMTFGMLDDRYSTDPEINSYHIVSRSAFYLRALRRGAVFLDSSVFELESLETYATRYESYIKKWLKLHPNGIIRATVGIGPDGHTSGVLPHPEDKEKFEKLFNAEKLIVGYDVGNKNPHRFRMTSTFTFMKKFDKVLTYMKGENKKEALQRVLAEEGDLAATPGRIIRELKDVQLFTDVEL
ncbi:MAG: Glucosamine-6-phosphate isomerase/6-phosphogluconolactonase [Candidatus Paceibacter sp.]|jgi:6-phosphogluconolactonase/glucosamine-6-phosphate isomerase/deaminase|nr:Glucosamine-6-phosphate isomerase/6-phosphogluconolactonase [Candidatus Paceibacter sp.]